MIHCNRLGWVYGAEQQRVSEDTRDAQVLPLYPIVLNIVIANVFIPLGSALWGGSTGECQANTLHISASLFDSRSRWEENLGIFVVSKGWRWLYNKSDFICIPGTAPRSRIQISTSEAAIPSDNHNYNIRLYLQYISWLKLRNWENMT